MRITKEMVMDLKPCYSEEQIDDLMAGRKWVGPATVAKLYIPLADKLWVLTKLMTDEQQRELARRCALDVILLWDAPDVVREYLETGNDDIRAAALDAAWSAASDAASDAARSAASDAARDAARSAARSAAWAAAWSAYGAASSAAYSAAASAAYSAASRDASREKHISWCVEYLESV